MWQAIIRAVLLLPLCTVLPVPAVAASEEKNLQAIEAYAAAYEEMAAFDGVILIAEGDDIVWQKSFGLADYRFRQALGAQSIFRIASLSKQVTKAAIGRLVDQDKLRIDSSLSAFLPDFPQADKITIRHLLDHAAGIPHTNRLAWMDMCHAMSLDEIVAALSKEAPLFAPGVDRQYSNGGYAVLAKIIEIASGQRFEIFLQEQFAAGGYSTIGHESAYEIVPGMVSRYAPGPLYGTRVEAETYITANRIGGGSLHAGAADVFQFFRDSYSGKLLSEPTTAALFPLPEDGEVQITGRSPGALAQIYMDFDEGLTVVTLSSNSAWPGSFNTDIVALYRGVDVALTPFSLTSSPMTANDINAASGTFMADRFGWVVSIVSENSGLVFVQDEIRTAFAKTTDGEFHLPIYDWLCRYGDYDVEFECRQRDPAADIRFRFVRQ